MKAYKIYLTKSREVAEIIASAKSKELGSDGETTCVRVGCAYGLESDLIPRMYQKDEYEYCLVEYESKAPKYEIVFA